MLYGMDPVPDNIYDLIMRADNGKATNLEHLLLEQYIKEKTCEIRKRKEALGIEGCGVHRRPGRMAENCLLNLQQLIIENDDDEEQDEY